MCYKPITNLFEWKKYWISRKIKIIHLCFWRTKKCSNRQKLWNTTLNTFSTNLFLPCTKSNLPMWLNCVIEKSAANDACFPSYNTIYVDYRIIYKEQGIWLDLSAQAAWIHQINEATQLAYPRPCRRWPTTLTDLGSIYIMGVPAKTHSLSRLWCTPRLITQKLKRENILCL